MFKNILKFLKPIHAEQKPKVVVQPEQALTREETIKARAKKMAAETTLPKDL